MKSPRRPSVFAAFLFASALFGIAQTPDLSTPLAPWPVVGEGLIPTPRATWGRLENGLRYVVLPNPTPAGATSLRLHIATGSLHEQDDERGYAHFIEHMAFNGTKNFAAGEFPKILQRQGAAFGAHVNATTSFEDTIYHFDLSNRAEGLATGLRILRDVADGILFEAAEVDRERGVILSEDLARENPNRRHYLARLDFLFKGTLLPDRLPIGTKPAIETATPERLRAFYDAWYRPEHMTLVVVGDFDAAAAEAVIRENFASLAARGPARATPSLGKLPVLNEPALATYRATHSGLWFELTSLRPERPLADSSSLRHQSARFDAACMMIRNRFARLRDQPKPPISSFTVDDELVVGHFRRIDVKTGGNYKQWSTVLATAEQELRRALDVGFEPAELATVKESLRAGVRTEAANMPTIHSGSLAGRVMYGISRNRVINFPDERLAARLEAIEQLTPENCRDAFREAWGITTPPRLFVSHHTSLSLKPQKIRDAYQASRATPLKTSKTAGEVAFAYTDFGPPGTVVRKEHIADLDIWLVEFANGVRLNLKKTDFENQQVLFRARLGTGRLEEPKDRPGLGHWIDCLHYGGLGKHNADEIRRALNGRVVSLNVHTDDEAFVFQGRASTAELPLGLSLLTANITDPAFRPEASDKMNSHFSDLYDPLRESPVAAMRQKITPFLAGGDPRFTLPDRKKISRYSLRNLKAWLKPTLQSGALECAIVGDIDVDAAIALVARTLGALPPRKPKPALTKERQLTLPSPPASRTFYYVSTTRPATLDFYWPVRTAASATERRGLHLLAEILEQRIDDKIREELGETYSSSASFSWNIAYPGFAHLRSTLEVKRDNVKKLLPVVHAIIDKLAREGITDDELSRVKAPALTTARQNQRNNSYWLYNVLDDAQEHPRRLDDARNLATDFEAITKAQLDALAARYLTPKNRFEFTIKPIDP